VRERRIYKAQKLALTLLSVYFLWLWKIYERQKYFIVQVLLLSSEKLKLWKQLPLHPIFFSKMLHDKFNLWWILRSKREHWLFKVLLWQIYKLTQWKLLIFFSVAFLNDSVDELNIKSRWKLQEIFNLDELAENCVDYSVCEAKFVLLKDKYTCVQRV